MDVSRRLISFFGASVLAVSFLVAGVGSTNRAIARPLSNISADSCPTPVVSEYDSSVVGMTPPSDVNDPEATIWLDYASSGGGMQKAIFTEDPKRDNIDYVDAQIASGRHSVTVADFNPAPTGPIAGTQYLAIPIVNVSETDHHMYLANARIEDAVTRDPVATSSNTVYSSDSTQSWDLMEQAGLQVTSVFDKIRAYQTQLRDSQPNMAIRADRPELTPAHPKVNVGGSTVVPIRLTDCDGTPLKGWKLKLTATHGTMSPTSVTTDAGGQATAKFHATSKGLAVLRAYAGPYTQVTHRTFDRFFGQAAVIVGVAKPSWLIHLQESMAYTSDDKSQCSGGGCEFVGNGHSFLDFVGIIQSVDPKADMKNGRLWTPTSTNASGSVAFSRRLLWDCSLNNGQQDLDTWTGEGKAYQYAISTLSSVQGGAEFLGATDHSSWLCPEDGGDYSHDHSTGKYNPLGYIHGVTWTWSGSLRKGYTARADHTETKQETGETRTVHATVTFTPVKG
jgi:hypothetical protein